MKNTITLAQAVQLIFTTRGKLFNVKFYKKDNTLRSMNCRLGVQKNLKGGKLKYNPVLHNLLAVYEIKQGYKMINLEGLKSLKIKGVQYEVL